MGLASRHPPMECQTSQSGRGPVGMPPTPPHSWHMRARATSSEKWDRPQHMQRSQPTRRTTLGGS